MELAQVELLKVAEGFCDAHVLLALNELGVFEALSAGPGTAEQIARAVGAQPEPLRRLLGAAVAIRVLTHHDDGRFSIGPLVGTLLDPCAPGYIGNWLRLLGRWAALFPGLADSVRSGRAAQEARAHLGSDPDYTRDFVRAMEDYARLRGREVADYAPLAGARNMLDLGGGSGTYAITFARRWPQLSVTVLDLPEIARLAESNVAAAGLAGRVRVRAADYHADDLGSGWDVVFTSDTLHQETPDGCASVLRKCYDALRPGGTLIIQGMFLRADKTGPRWPAMHSLIMLLVSGAGRAYSIDEMSRLVEDSGFVECRQVRMSLLNVNSLLVSERPR